MLALQSGHSKHFRQPDSPVLQMCSFKQDSQNVWRHDKAFGTIKASKHIEQVKWFVLLSDTPSLVPVAMAMYLT